MKRPIVPAGFLRSPMEGSVGAGTTRNGLQLLQVSSGPPMGPRARGCQIKGLVISAGFLRFPHGCADWGVREEMDCNCYRFPAVLPWGRGQGSAK